MLQLVRWCVAVLMDDQCSMWFPAARTVWTCTRHRYHFGPHRTTVRELP
jgi:hypothetical protein